MRLEFRIWNHYTLPSILGCLLDFNIVGSIVFVLWVFKVSTFPGFQKSGHNVKDNRVI